MNKDLFNIYDVVVFEDENGITQDCVCSIGKDIEANEIVDMIECNNHSISIYEDGNYLVCEKDEKGMSYYASDKKITHLYTLKNDNRLYEVYPTNDYESINKDNPSEALEKLFNAYKELCEDTGSNEHIYQECNLKSPYNIIKKALQRLEVIDKNPNLIISRAIKEAKPSEALEAVDKIIEHLKYEWYQNKFLDLDICFTTIKQSLIKAQKDKVIADFIREHYKLSDDINENYLELKKPITEEEHNKFQKNL